jgi:hypothetical protein
MQVRKAKSGLSKRSVSHTDRPATITKIKRSGEDGSRPDGQDGGTVEPIGFHFLTKNLGTISKFNLEMMSNNYDRPILGIVDTEEKQLQAILDLYAIVKAQPKYKDLKEPNWTESHTPVDVLYWLLRKLGPLAQGNDWFVDTYKQGNRNRYRFVVYRFYHSQKVKSQEEYMPLDFLPFLLKRDKPLHDLIVDTVALVSKCNKVPLWDEDGDFSEQMERLLSAGGNTGNDVLDAQYKCYKNGVAAQYLRLIKRRRKVVTTSSVQELLAAYSPESERKRFAIRWIASGIRMAEWKESINKYSYVPNYLTGTPITPYRLYKFVWSLHKNDYVRIHAYQKYKKDEKSGFILPRLFSVTHPGEVMKPMLSGLFPELLYDFMIRRPWSC